MVVAVVLYGVLLLGSLVLVGLGLFSVGDGFARWRERAALTDVPTVSLDSVAVGTTAVRGRLAADDSITVPVDGRRCVCYDLTVEDSTDLLPLVERREAAAGLRLVDDTGSVPLEPEGFRLDLTDDRHVAFEVASYDEPDDRVAAFCEREDLPAQGMRRDRTFEYDHLRAGDEVYAYGSVEPAPDADGKGVVLAGGDDAFLSDKPVEDLLAERRHALVRHVARGVAAATAGLAGLLLLTGVWKLLPLV